MMTVGYMRMPADFKYLNVFLKGKPRHNNTDPFMLKHPAMDCGRRAKIFSPFDALKGFSEAVAAKDVLYVNRPELDEEDKAEINRRLSILYGLTRNGRMARNNSVTVTVTYFVPCTDENSFAFGHRGQVTSVTGTCWKVDGSVTRSVLVGQATVRFDDIISIEGKGIFDEDWELDAP